MECYGKFTAESQLGKIRSYNQISITDETSFYRDASLQAFLKHFPYLRLQTDIEIFEYPWETN